MFNDHVVARRVRTRIARSHVPSIARALTTATAVPYDTLYPLGTNVVVDIINQHAAGDGTHATLYPAPAPHADDPDGDLFAQPRDDLTCDAWQFTYTDGVVHAHISLHDRPDSTVLCVTPFRERGGALLATTSRRSERSFKPIWEMDAPDDVFDEFERYLFLRDNRAIRAWNFVAPKDIDHIAYVEGGPAADPAWQRELSVPGFDLAADLTEPYMDTTYTLRRK